MWPNAKIGVMGGEQAASVLATIQVGCASSDGGLIFENYASYKFPLLQRDNKEAAGKVWSPEEEASFKAPIRSQYEKQASRSLLDVLLV